MRVVSPEATERLRSFVQAGQIEYRKRSFRANDLDGASLVFAATDRPEVNRAVCVEAQKRGLFCNSADQLQKGDFIVPSVLHRKSLSVAVVTGGGSPAFSRLMREELEDMLGDEYGEMVVFLEQIRPRVMARFEDPQKRREVWKRLVNSQMVELVRQQRWDQIEELVSQCLS